MDMIIAETNYKKYLDDLPLATLRVLGRMYGVPQASATHKSDLASAIAAILSGRVRPGPRSNRGAPPKASFIDPAILADLEKIADDASKIEHKEEMLRVSSSTPEPKYPYLITSSAGVLEITPSGYGFLRAKNCQPSTDGDVYLAAPAIHSMNLREGDYVVCTTKPRVGTESPAIQHLISVNQLSPGKYENRPRFEALTARHPCEKIALSAGETDLALRELDLFVPIGKGQRGLIIAPPKAGKTTLLKSIAHAVSVHHPEIELIILLVDERPEEVTDMRSNVRTATIISSTFDESPEHHIRAAQLTLARAKRLVELGKHVVILLDSITKLTRAYNCVVETSGKLLSGGLDPAALAEPKRFFGAARSTVEQGSLTILATALVETGSRMDDVIYEEFKGTGNADIFLSRELAERRIFPAIDLRRSGTRKEELLLTKEELAAVYKLRERGLAENASGIIDMLRRTQDNADFVAKLPEWLRVYKA